MKERLGFMREDVGAGAAGAAGASRVVVSMADLNKCPQSATTGALTNTPADWTQKVYQWSTGGYARPDPPRQSPRASRPPR